MSKFYPLTVASVRHETRDCISVTLSVPDELAAQFRYQQGQHLTLRTTIDEEDVRRSYSICSAVQDGALRVAIKRTPGGLFSCWANDNLKSGMTLDVMPPMGHFNVPLDPANARHYLAFAAGSGITRRAEVAPRVPCPQCGSEHTRLVSQFGSTPCKALYKCLDCLEPFDYFKCH